MTFCFRPLKSIELILPSAARNPGWQNECFVSDPTHKSQSGSAAVISTFACRERDISFNKANLFFC